MAVHPSVGRVTKVHHTMNTAEGYAHFNSDLIFVGKIPTVVLEWEILPDGDHPGTTVPLDRNRLHKVDWPNAEYMYEDPIEHPRGPQPIQRPSPDQDR
jgi:hypothetical protein